MRKVKKVDQRQEESIRYSVLLVHCLTLGNLGRTKSYSGKLGKSGIKPPASYLCLPTLSAPSRETHPFCDRINPKDSTLQHNRSWDLVSSMGNAGTHFIIAGALSKVQILVFSGPGLPDRHICSFQREACLVSQSIIKCSFKKEHRN